MPCTTIHPIVSIGAVGIATLIANAGGPTHTWLNPVNGNWTDPAKWNTGTVPGASDGVLLGHVGAYSVGSGGNISALSLSITNPDAEFTVNNANTLSLFGDLHNEGTIGVNLTGGGSATQLDFNANAMITGSGRITLGSFASRSRIRTGAGFMLTQGSTHTIHGYGQIDANLVNNGTISADVSSQQLMLNAEPKGNNAIMEAVSGGILNFGSLTVTQGAGGRIIADGPGSRVDFNSTTVLGGELRSENGASLEVVNGTFDAVTLSGGELNVQNARTLDIFNSITNEGVVTVNPGGNGSATQIDFENSGSFLGSGTVVLDSFGSRARLRTATGMTMTNTPSHTIRGWGLIEADFINNGLVSADVAAQELFLNTNTKRNNAVMRAEGGGILDFASVLVSQAPGGVLVADGPGSRIDFNGTTITNGQINAVNGGRVEIVNATYDGVSITGPHDLQNARTLDVFNSIVNNGTITINPASSGSATQLDFENSGSFLGNGEVVLNSYDARARLRTATGATMTNTADHTIRGWGRIEAALINDGLVRADVLDNAIFLSTDDKVNNSTIAAVDGATLNFISISVDQTGGGEITSDGAGSMIELNTATIVGGDLMTTNDARVEVIDATLNGVNFDGLMNLQNARTLSIENSITNNGSIVVNPTGAGSATQIRFIDDGAFNGNGSVRLASFDSRAQIQTAEAVTAVNSANHSIFGMGRIDADMVNNGLIRADVPANKLFFRTNNKENNSTISAVNEAGLSFDAIEIIQGPGGQIFADGANTEIDLNSTTIINGQLWASNGGQVVVANATLDGVDCEATIGIENSRNMSLLNGVINNGTIVVNKSAAGSVTSLTWLDDSVLGGTGSVILNSLNSRSRINIGANSTMATLGENQRLGGIGSIQAPLTHHGTTAPGLSIGTMFASQPITYTDSSVFEAEVNAATSDLLDSNSTVALDGTLEVIYTDGFAPAGYWARTIIEGSDITGKFTSVDIPAPASGFVTRVVNTGTALIVGQTCPSDTNLDGILNFFDVSTFLNAFAGQQPVADLNNDGVYNFFDVSLFLNNFSTGCPL